MLTILIAISLMTVLGSAALVAGRRTRAATAFGVAGSVGGAAIAIVPAVRAAVGGRPETLLFSWGMPLGGFTVTLDALAGFFLIPIVLLPALAAVYGAKYLDGREGKKNLGAQWFFYNALTAGMALAVVAANGLLFLVAWEVMSLASFFLVTFENEREDARETGWTYLIATHIGTAFLLAMFVMMGAQAGSLDFAALASAGFPAAKAGLFFVLALIGFGTKAGFMPLHVWLPEAHPAAPSHVSAVMSGVMIKTGIYGIVRIVILLGTPPSWWGWTLIAIGATSGIMGVLYALAQHDIKRLLAYHSVENIGIIALGLGVGLLGVSAGSPAIAALGIAGGLLHVLNHALFKGLLFMGAGAVIHGTGTREIDHLGGLLKRMPWTGVTFLIGAAAISGLPPLNGFVSELLIYIGAFTGGQTLAWEGAAAAIAAIGALALIGGLAAACFTKAFGAIFLGEPRSQHASHAHEAAVAMRAPMVALAAGCVLIGLLSPLVVGQLGAVVALVTAIPPGEVAGPISQAVLAMWYVSAAAAALVILGTALLVTRRTLLSKRDVTEAGTWDCGYAEPTARMQYTSSSFAQPLVHLFRVILRTRTLLKAPKGFFPAGASFSTETPDAAREGFYGPIFAWVGRALLRLGVLQRGSIHVYILYIVLTLLALLLWKLR